MYNKEQNKNNNRQLQVTQASFRTTTRFCLTSTIRTPHPRKGQASTYNTRFVKHFAVIHQRISDNACCHHNSSSSLFCVRRSYSSSSFASIPHPNSTRICDINSCRHTYSSSSFTSIPHFSATSIFDTVSCHCTYYSCYYTPYDSTDTSHNHNTEQQSYKRG